MEQGLFCFIYSSVLGKSFPYGESIFIHVCFSVLIKESDDEDDANDDDGADDGDDDVACQAWLNLCFILLCFCRPSSPSVVTFSNARVWVFFF